MPTLQIINDGLRLMSGSVSDTPGMIMDPNKMGFGTAWIASAVNAMFGLFTKVFSAGSCDAPQAAGLGAWRAIIGVLEHMLGTPLPEAHRTVEYYINYLCPTKIPDAAQAIEAVLAGSTDPATAAFWVKADGYCPEPYSVVADSRREKLQTVELIQHRRRNGWQDQQIIDALGKQGWLRPDEAIARVELYDELPTISDHLHWLQRNVFDTQYVQDYQLMDGFEERFWAMFGSNLHSIGMKKEYAALHYAAHWINPAPGQLQEMVYRLRPDKPGVQNPFTLQDYGRILAEQDVAPYFRNRFSEIAYRVPALGYLRDMYRQGVINDDDLRGYHQDLGYTDQDSQRFVSVDAIAKIRQRTEQARGWTPIAIAHGYISGYGTKDDVYRSMDRLGYTHDEADALMARADSDLQYTTMSRARSRVVFSALTSIKKAIAAGVMSNLDAVQALENLGWKPEFAAGWVGIQASDAEVTLVKAATARIRSALFAGEIDANYVLTALGALGVTPDVASKFLTVWQVEMTPNRKRRGAAQIVNDVVQGMMSLEEALGRLMNLGFEDRDRQLFTADIQRKLAHKTAGTTAAKLQAWVKDGYISREQFWQNMQWLGYPADKIPLYYEEACAKTGAKCV